MKITEIPFSPGSHVFGYLRDSGHEDQELSISQQETAMRDWCAQHGLVLSNIYKDEAKRGSSVVSRENLHAMMNAFRHGCDEAGVIVWKYNRFARNVDNAQYYRAEIRSRGYIFYSMNDKIPDGPEGRLLEAVIDFKDEQFLIDLSIDVKRGLRDLVLKYRCVPGVPPTGFMREKVIIGQRRDGRDHIAHKWVPDPAYVDRVRRAFEMRAAGDSLGKINKETNLFKSINSYRDFWINKLYIGILEFGDEVIDDYCEPLIDQKTWNLVQAKQNGYTRRSHMKADALNHPRRVASKYLLSGIAHCARCGSPLFGTTSRQRNGSKMASYFCSKAYRTRDCVRHRIPIEALDETVLTHLRDEWLSEEKLKIAFEELFRQNVERYDEQSERIRALNIELGETRRQITNISNAIAESGHSRALLNRLSDLEATETQQLTRLTELNALQLHTVKQVTEEQLQMALARLERILNGTDIQEQRNFLQQMIERVDVDREERKLFGFITFYYPPVQANEKPPPGTAQPGGGNDTVRKPTAPSGPPRFTHSIKFEHLINGKSGRYKKSC